MISYRFAGKTLAYPNPSSTAAIASGAVVSILAGNRGACGVAADTINPLATGALWVYGVHELAANPAGPSGSGAAGEKLYWDTVNLYVTDTPSGTTTALGSLHTGDTGATWVAGDPTVYVSLPGPGVRAGGAPAAAALTNDSGITDSSGGTASGSATLAAVTENATLTDSTGGTGATTFAAITAGVTYAQTDMVAVKNALSETVAQLNLVRAALIAIVSNGSTTAAQLNALQASLKTAGVLA